MSIADTLPLQAWAQLTVSCLTASVHKPSIYPLISCCPGMSTSSVGCLVKGYFPEPVTVTWDTDSPNVAIHAFPALNFNSSSLISASQMMVSGSSSKLFKCRVIHAASSLDQTKTFSGE